MSQESSDNRDGQNSPAENQPKSLPLPDGWLGKHPWVTFLLPFIVYMLVGQFEPKPPQATTNDGETAIASSDESEDVATLNEVADLEEVEIVESEGVEDSSGWFPQLPYRHYPVVYTAKVALTCIAMLIVFPGYRTFPFRVSWLAVLVGSVGIVLWIGICKLDLEQEILPSLGLGSFVASGERSAFNPLEQLANNKAWAYGFLAIRLFGLAVVVPIIEEFFLRGFVMRFVMHDNWHQIPFGHVNRTAVIVGTALPMLMHPAELVAAFVWFSMVTWLMVRTRSIWDCVVAHMVTNALLGAYVIWSGDWHLM